MFKKILTIAVCLCFIVLITPASSLQQKSISTDFTAAMKHYRQGHYATAIEQLSLVVEKEPQNAAAYYFLGYAHYTLHHNEEALTAFAKAFEADPNFDPRPYFIR